jgi:hypothetical protein
MLYQSLFHTYECEYLLYQYALLAGLHEVVCEGKVHGSIVAHRVVLRARAVVIGNVRATSSIAHTHHVRML